MGGLAWPDMLGNVVLARLADQIETGPCLRKALWDRRPHVDAEAIRRLDGRDDAEDLMQFAAALGVKPGPSGLPAEVASKDPLGPPAPARHLLSAFMGAFAQQRQ